MAQRIDRDNSRIDRRAPDQPERNLARKLPEETDVAIPLDLLAPETLISLVSVVRRPPELQLTAELSQISPGLNGVDPAEMRDLSQMSTPDLGYRIASLLVRRESEVAQSNDPFVKAGFAELELSARMLEHLMIKRTSSVG